MNAINDKFPPQQVKETIGQLSIASVMCTDPANKLSLTSARISKIQGVMRIKCQEWVMPGLFDVLYQTVLAMIRDVKSDAPNAALYETCETLEKTISDAVEYQTKEKSKFMAIESLQLINDFNQILECRKRWQIASDTYMANNASWAASNKMIADIHDILEVIELRYNLAVIPKNVSFNVNDINMFKGEE